MRQASFFDGQTSDAIFSPDRSCRLLLRRVWMPTRGYLMFIGLNPSTANEEQDDPTIRRLLGFAKSWGLGGILVCNLFTKITPHPHELPEVAPIQDDAVLLHQAEHAGMILAGWGAFPKARYRAAHVKSLLAKFKLFCLGLNADGSPRHPLYIAAQTKPQLFGIPNAPDRESA